MHILKTNFNGNPNVGLYAFATDKYCLVGHEVPQESVDEIEKVLKVPVHRVSIAGTGLVGVFVNGNSKKLLIPSIVFRDEIYALEKLELDFAIINTKNTALGNNILLNDEGVIISPIFEKEAVNEIEKALGLKPLTHRIAGIDTVGSVAAHNTKGCLIHHNAKDDDIRLVENTLKVECTTGTINFGSPYIKSGILVNSNGMIVGDISGGPEVQNADQALGFMPK